MNITRKKAHKPKTYHPLLADAPLKVLHQDNIILSEDTIEDQVHMDILASK